GSDLVRGQFHPDGNPDEHLRGVSKSILDLGHGFKRSYIELLDRVQLLTGLHSHSCVQLDKRVLQHNYITTEQRNGKLPSGSDCR
ncbi:MAG: hypothetical protein OK442_08285, partial [Thaumarchaeota archaeon]|nr:hypothetical protein [Nitrososphaerota archaeon]